MRLCYLAYPIDLAGNGERVPDLLGHARNLLQQRYKTGYYDPGRALNGVQNLPVGPEINTINRAALDACDALLALLPANTPSVGVPIEIDRAKQAGKPLAVVTDAHHSWALDGYPSYPYHPAGVEQAIAGLLHAPPQNGQPLPVQALHEAAQLPSRAYADDAGLDLYLTADVTVEPGSFADLPCGVAVQLPPDTWGLLTGRSSTLRKRGLMVANGVIDTGYRGELYCAAWNLRPEPVQVKSGERLGQLILLTNRTRGLQPTWAQKLDEHRRGQNGFGSSGI